MQLVSSDHVGGGLPVSILLPPATVICLLDFCLLSHVPAQRQHFGWRLLECHMNVHIVCCAAGSKPQAQQMGKAGHQIDEKHPLWRGAQAAVKAR